MDTFDVTMNVLVTLCLLIFAGREFWRWYFRSAQDVLESLSAQRAEDDKSSKREPSDHKVIDENVAALGFQSKEEYLRYCFTLRIFPFILVLLLIFAKNLFFSPSGQSTVALALMAIPVAYLVYKRCIERRRARYLRKINFHLPLVMERLVMGAQAGLDIIAAIGVITEIERRKALATHEKMDPVTFLLFRVYQLTESGVSFDKALSQLVAQIPCSALKHAFIHLATAYKNGGELVMPLRELSDSTQTFYQESKEEEIAKLPVKATAPLICVFAGLMIIFMTSPMLKIIEILSRTKLN